MDFSELLREPDLTGEEKNSFSFSEKIIEPCVVITFEVESQSIQLLL